jgi:hypothetical protein
MNPLALVQSAALRYVLLVEAMNIFADFTYEGAWIVTGHFLTLLAAAGTIVGVVDGFGELTEYVLRAVSAASASA